MVRRKVKPVASDEILPERKSRNSAVGDEVGKKDVKMKKGKDVTEAKVKEKKFAGKKKKKKKRDNGVRKRDEIVGKRDSTIKEVKPEKGGNVMGKKRKRGADGEIVEEFLLLSPRMDESASRLRPRKQVPSFRGIALGEGDFSRIVGKRVKVFWPGSRRWFFGRVASFDSEKMVHAVFYDDGDKEELNLMEERFELEVMPDEVFSGSDAEVKVGAERKGMGSHQGKVDGEGTFKKEDLDEKGDAQLEKKGAKTKKGKITSKAVERGSKMQREKKDNGQKEVKETSCKDMQAAVLPTEYEEVISKESDDMEKPGDDNSEKNHDEIESKAPSEINQTFGDAKDTKPEIDSENINPEILAGKKEKIENSESEGDKARKNGSEEKNTSGGSSTDYIGLQPPVDSQIEVAESQAGLASVDSVLNRGSNMKTVDLQLPADGKTMKDKAMLIKYVRKSS